VGGRLGENWKVIWGEKGTLKVKGVQGWRSGTALKRVKTPAPERKREFGTIGARLL